MTKVVQTGPMTGGGASQPDFPGKSVESSPDLTAIQTITSSGYEKVRDVFTKCSISITHIFGKRFLR